MIKGKTVAAVVVAAGNSTRMGFDKLFCKIQDQEVLRRSVQALAGHPYVDTLVVVAGENAKRVQALFDLYPLDKPLVVVRGGATRAHSVVQGVRACREDLVAIHDGARPFVSPGLIGRTIEAAAQSGAAAPGVPVKDTIKVEWAGQVQETLDRSRLRGVQTPQVFERKRYLAAFDRLQEEELPAVTDDCMVLEMAGLPVQLVEGEYENYKITTPEDLPQEAPRALRVGHGYDVHALVAGRKLILGGVDIPHEKGLDGHSDADVLCHALSDALLGACALGDIGKHFPDTDSAYKGADSLVLLEKVAQLLRREGYRIINLDGTILCQRPRLAPHVLQMRGNIARAVGLREDAVSIKATTEEKLGFTGQEQGIAAHCVVLVEK